MTSFSQGFDQPFNPKDDNKAWFDALSKVAPELAEALQGDLTWNEKNQKRPPMTLMVYCRDGVLKFSLSSRFSRRSYYGVVKSPGELLESVEHAMNLGEGEWVKKRED
jgi:hypothetical protein